MAGKIYQSDIGTVFEVDMSEDISEATLVELHILKPSGAEVEWTGSVYDTNYIRYTTIENDLDEEGWYVITPYLEFETWQGYGETVEEKIYAKYH